MSTPREDIGKIREDGQLTSQGEGLGQALPSQPSGGTSPAHHDCGLLASSTETVSVESQPACGAGYGSPGRVVRIYFIFHSVTLLITVTCLGVFQSRAGTATLPHGT